MFLIITEMTTCPSNGGIALPSKSARDRVIDELIRITIRFRADASLASLVQPRRPSLIKLKSRLSLTKCKS